MEKTKLDIDYLLYHVFSEPDQEPYPISAFIFNTNLPSTNEMHKTNLQTWFRPKTWLPDLNKSRVSPNYD